MQNCLGIYIEDNLIKYAKVSKEKNNNNYDFKVEAFGIKFFDNLSQSINQIIEETYSFNTPVSINLMSEKYLYYDIFSLLSKKDIEKAVETEFEEYCDENKYNQKAFETRYALVPNVNDKEKIRAMQIIVNKIELNKQKQYLEKHKLTKVAPIGIAIANIAKFEKNENAIIVNMEENTTITTILDNQIYNVETLEFGSQEVLEKRNHVENSIQRAYEICKETTIYTSNVLEDTKEQPHLEDIMPTVYQVCQRIQEIVASTPQKISTIYLTGTLAAINNIDLYFQEYLTAIECKILRPKIVEETVSQVNIKDYIEVNSAIALAMQGLGEGIQAFNFRRDSSSSKLNELLNFQINTQSIKEVLSSERFSLKGDFSTVEKILVRCSVAIILINIIFLVFSKVLYKQMENKENEINALISSEQKEVGKIEKDIDSLNSKNTAYQSLTEGLKAINDKISHIAERKNSIPNLLNQLMFIIPEEVQLTSLENKTEKDIKMTASAPEYDKLGYFVAKLKLEGILKDVITSSSQSSGGSVSITIEGELP